MKNNICSLLLVLGFSGIALASAIADPSAADKAFVMKAAQGGMTEVKLGQLAADKASSPDVKSFGAKMVTDHGQANSELMSIASTKGITVPTDLDSKHQAMVDKLSALSGAAFDKEYVAAMLKAHMKDDKLFSTEATDGQDADIKAFASKTDQTVKEHLSMIQGINSSMASSK